MRSVGPQWTYIFNRRINKNKLRISRQMAPLGKAIRDLVRSPKVPVKKMTYVPLHQAESAFKINKECT